MIVLFGYIFILLCVFGGFALSGGHLKAIMQPLELLIICGAAIGSLIVGNSLPVLKATFKAFGRAFKNPKSSKVMYGDLLALMYALLNKARQEGMMSLEADVDDPHASAIFSAYPRIMKEHHLVEFICDYLRLIITANMQPFQLEALMDAEIENHHHEESLPINAITKLADGLPAFGIVAAVLGVVHTMESISLPPAQLGILVARALVGTFLGILLGYGFVAPIAATLEQRAGEMQLLMNCVKTILLANLHNNPPIISIEYGRKVLYANARPSFNQLNEDIKQAKAS